jgi:hypothetical protein
VPRLRLLLVLACAAGVAGCSSLLPRTVVESVSPHASFEAAREAFERIEPYRTTLPELKSLGFDATAGGTAQQVPYPQLIGYLVANPTVPFERLDTGIRECFEARQACRAFIFRLGTEVQERRGAFLADFLNFRRVTHTSGWRFEGVVLVRGDTVMFRNHGGEPSIDRVEERVNPLGPLQAFGEAAVRAGAMP